MTTYNYDYPRADYGGQRESSLQRFRADSVVGVVTLFRISLGVTMAAHGWQKLTDMAAVQGGFSQMGIPAPGVTAYLVMLAELLGGLGLIFGLLTPLASVPIALVMLGAIGFVHWPNGLFAKDGGFEYPMLILFSSLYFATRGAGPVSVDALVRRWSAKDADPRTNRDPPPDSKTGEGREPIGAP